MTLIRKPRLEFSARCCDWKTMMNWLAPKMPRTIVGAFLDDDSPFPVIVAKTTCTHVYDTERVELSRHRLGETPESVAEILVDVYRCSVVLIVPDGADSCRLVHAKWSRK